MSDLGRLKIEAAADRVHELSPDTELELIPRRVKAENARALVDGFDIILDGSDNFATRFALAEACLQGKKPLVSAAISSFAAQLSTFKPYLGKPHPCYRCFVPEAPEREIT
jgi:molybdopterin-synthase adenylyltransferase